MPTSKHYPVAVIGGGLVGLTLAYTLAQHGIAVAVFEKHVASSQAADSLSNPRVSAINDNAWRYLKHLALDGHIQANQIGQLEGLCVWDSMSGSEIQFNSAEIGAQHLGVIVANHDVTSALWQALKQHENADLFCPATMNHVQLNPHPVTLQSDTTTITADLVVGADGAQSWLRQHLNLPTIERPYHHSALICCVTTEKPHESTGWQAFLPNGILALLPRASANHTAIVWSTTQHRHQQLMAMTEDEFNIELNNDFGQRLGHLTTCSSRQSFPLVMRHANDYVKPGLALIGDAAHCIHPLAGQGVNLGIMDATCLAQCIIDAVQKRQSLNSFKPLRRYQRWRKGDNTLMLIMMRAIKELFANQSALVIPVRQIGINSINRMQTLKKQLMNIAMGYGSERPNIML